MYLKKNKREVGHALEVVFASRTMAPKLTFQRLQCRQLLLPYRFRLCLPLTAPRPVNLFRMTVVKEACLVHHPTRVAAGLPGYTSLRQQNYQPPPSPARAPPPKPDLEFSRSASIALSMSQRGTQPEGFMDAHRLGAAWQGETGLGWHGMAKRGYSRPELRADAP
jgi:hypothetical protein